MFIKNGFKDSNIKEFDSKPFPKQECLLEQAAKAEENKPPHLRSRVFMISCSCPKCRPYSY
jgi:hypothetical protein